MIEFFEGVWSGLDGVNCLAFFIFLVTVYLAIDLAATWRAK